MLAGLILAFVRIAFLIYFIYHISMSIQASSIIAGAHRRPSRPWITCFPKGWVKTVTKTRKANSQRLLENQPWSAVPARKTGYIESIDADALLDVAREHGTILRMERGIGEFVVEGAPLVSVVDPGGLDDETAPAIFHLC